jgi:hypothetical protein
MMSENLFSPEQEARIRLQNLGDAEGGDGLDGNRYDGGNQGGGEGGNQGQGQGGEGGNQGQGQGQGGEGGNQSQGQGGEGVNQGNGQEGNGQEGDDGEGEGDEGDEGEGQVEGEGEGENEGENEGEDEAENEGEDEAEDEGEDENEEQEEETDKNDERIGKRCIVIFPKEMAGLLGTIQEVRFRGVPQMLNSRNINGYVLQLPSVEYTLFSVSVTNLKGENEILPLMDIDIAFSGQNISYVESGISFQNQVVQFVRTEPNLYLIDIGGANRLAEHCFITPEQANQQNNNNQNDNDADDEDEDDDNTPYDLIPSAFFTYLYRDIFGAKIEGVNEIQGYEEFSVQMIIAHFSRKFFETNEDDFFNRLVDSNIVQKISSKEFYFIKLPDSNEDRIKKLDIQALQTFLIFSNALKSKYGDIKNLPFVMASALFDLNNSNFLVWINRVDIRQKIFLFDDLNAFRVVGRSYLRFEQFIFENQKYDSVYEVYLGMNVFRDFDLMDFFAPTNKLGNQEEQKQNLQRDMLGYLQSFLI